MPANRTEYHRKYREANRKKIRAYNRVYNKLWRKENGYHNEVRWNKDHPIAVHAKRMLRKAIEEGIVKKQPCALCGKKKVVAHHSDYSRPLKVVWLCAEDDRKQHHKDVK